MFSTIPVKSDNPSEYLAEPLSTLSSDIPLRTSPSQKKRILLLLVIDFSDFMCMNCLESFLSFCRSIPPRHLEDKTWGVCVVENKDDTPAKKSATQIAEKKLRGFISANRISFPIIIDHDRVFHSFAVRGTSLVLFDAGSHRIAQYSFPLSRVEKQNIHEFFLKN